MHRFNALIFDLDGTLIDSLDDIAGAVNRALRAVDRPAARREDVRGWIGDGLPALCARAWPGAEPDALSRFVKHVAAEYRDHCADQTAIYPNVMQMLELLRAEQTPMAVLTNKPHDLTQQIMVTLGLHLLFGAIAGYQREEDKKPSPTIALRLAEMLGCSPETVGLVGDSAIDILTARNAGMGSIAVSWGFRNRDELAAARPDELVDDPLEIVKFISRWA